MVGTERYLRSFNMGIICTYFLVSVRILAAKFWIFCNFRTLVLLVLAQTVEQKYSLLNTRDVITFSKVLESRRYLILLISHKTSHTGRHDISDMFIIAKSSLHLLARQDP